MSFASFAATLALFTSAVAAEPIIPIPTPEVLAEAWAGIADPQLAAQLRPEGPFAPADCVVHLGIYRPLASPKQRIAIDRAGKAWRAAVVREFEGSETEAAQMIASSVNPLADTPPVLRQAAAAWCVANAPNR
jgi:hypothetical protein